MWKKIYTPTLVNPWRTLAKHHSTSVSSAVDSILLRSLKDHYLEVSKMAPPPKISPPSAFTIIKGAIETNGPVLKRNYGEDEEITISVMRLANHNNNNNNVNDDDQINQLFLHVDVSRKGKEYSLNFLCGLYPDAMGIHSVSMGPKLQTNQFSADPNKYGGPIFHDLDEKAKDALHHYIEERGVNEDLFLFLQAWLYVRDHRNFMRWFKTVGSFISEQKSAGAAE